MYGRATIIDGKPELVEAGLRFLSSTVEPAVNALPGYLGMSTLADRDSGRVVVISAWADEASRDQSAEAVGPLRQEASAILGGDARTETWELAAMHQTAPDQPGFVTRSVLMTGSAQQVEQALAQFQDKVVPQVTKLPGFNTISVLVDRQHGRLRVATTYVDRASADAAREAGAAIRGAISKELGLHTETVEDLQVISVGIRGPQDAARTIQLPVEENA
jgi:heme-degrading monooxygenase HmoA